jgi:hypothetical protein
MCLHLFVFDNITVYISVEAIQPAVSVEIPLNLGSKLSNTLQKFRRMLPGQIQE